MGDEEREAAAVVADPGLVDFLGGPRTAKNEEGVNIEDEREAESPSPNNREAKWRRGFEELEAENLAFRKAMLKLEDQLRLEKYNLEREKLEKIEAKTPSLLRQAVSHRTQKTDRGLLAGLIWKTCRTVRGPQMAGRRTVALPST